MRKNLVKEKIARGETAVGCEITFYAPFVVELIGVCGFDHVMINCEYGTITDWQVEHLCQLAELRGLIPFVRVPAGGNLENCRRMLDRGAMGIMMPHVRTPEYAKAFVKACKYMPEGDRSQCSRIRTNDFGALSPKEYSAMANRETMCIALCENRENLDNIEAIAAVPGLDVIYIGPGDLGADLGWPEPSAMKAHGDKMHRAILAAGKGVGGGVRYTGIEEVKASGCRFIDAITHDMLKEAYQEFIRQAKGGR